jgi:hypothetical protein
VKVMRRHRRMIRPAIVTGAHCGESGAGVWSKQVGSGTVKRTGRRQSILGFIIQPRWLRGIHETTHLRHERDTHAQEAKLGCEKGGSNKETEVGWQEGCENEKAAGSRRRDVVHDGKVGFDVAASSCHLENGKSAAVFLSCEYFGTHNHDCADLRQAGRRAESLGVLPQGLDGNRAQSRRCIRCSAG